MEGEVERKRRGVKAQCKLKQEGMKIKKRRKSEWKERRLDDWNLGEEGSEGWRDGRKELKPTMSEEEVWS